jgi:predicted ribonuclease YlaK
LAESVKDLRGLSKLLPPDDYARRLTPDTNTLIDNPDLAAHTAALGPRYMAHVLPVVFGELDDLKRSGRTPDLREAAKKADRRLKGLRDNGDVRTGATVSGDVAAVFEYAEPSAEGLPGWLDLSVPDDRFVAAALQLQSQHPGSALYVATGDLNMQNKLSAVGLPFVELP